jgi:hypothetical protein
MPTFSKCLATASVLTMLVLTGCGSSDKGGGGGNAQTFTLGASAICKSQTAQLQALPKPTTSAAVGPYLDKLSSLTHANRAKLGNLQPPPDKQAGFVAYLAALDAQLAKFDKARAVADAGQVQQALVMLKAAEPSGRAVKAKAGALGLTDCAA